MTSYNQIVNIVKSVTDGHLQLKSFHEGDLWDIGASGKVEYPSLWFSTQEGIGSAEIDIESKKLVLKAKLLILDKVQPDKSNEVEVKSDTLQIACDIIAQLQETEGISIENNLTLEPRTDAFDDQLTGWEVYISIRVDYLSERCGVPSEYGIEIPEGIGAWRVDRNLIIE